MKSMALARPNLPWLIFLFLASVFFLCQHELSYSKRGMENFNASEDEITAAVAEGTPTRRISLLVLGVFAIINLILNRAGKDFRINGPLGWILLSFATWAALSLIWAEDAALTFRRLVEFAILCSAAIVIARRLALREIVLWTFFSSGVYLFIGIVAEIALSTFQPFASGYRFAGTLHPNHQGINCALLVLSGVAAADMESNRRMIFRCCALCGFVFLILTGSRTSFAATILALMAYFGAVWSVRAKFTVAYALCILFCVLALAFGDGLLPDLKSAVMLGRDSSSVDSFNGRAGIWDETSFYIQRHPILGYGYGGFWTPTRIAEISDQEKWGTGEGHSTYLDCLLNLGLVGIILYVVGLFGSIWCAFHLHNFTQNRGFAFCGALILFCALGGLLESAMLESPSLTFLITTVIVEISFGPSPLGDTVVS